MAVRLKGIRTLFWKDGIATPGRRYAGGEAFFTDGLTDLTGGGTFDKIAVLKDILSRLVVANAPGER